LESIINALPTALGRDAPFATIDICVVKSVVAPQSRSKITASIFPSGDGARIASRLPQRLVMQPDERPRRITIQIARRIQPV
jgi:hypothetical protein